MKPYRGDTPLPIDGIFAGEASNYIRHAEQALASQRDNRFAEALVAYARATASIRDIIALPNIRERCKYIAFLSRAELKLDKLAPKSIPAPRNGEIPRVRFIHYEPPTQPVAG